MTQEQLLRRGRIMLANPAVFFLFARLAREELRQAVPSAFPIGQTSRTVCTPGRDAASFAA